MDHSRFAFPQTWEDVCNNPLLADLPYRVEINRQGNIELSPHSRKHSKYQHQIGRLLDRLMPPGQVVPECAVQCGPATPVADVSWFSPERDAACGNEFAAIVAPEICIEVRSPSNSRREMEAKREDYFEAGTLECWFCDLSGAMRFYGPEGELEQSRLCPEFPKQVAL